MQNFIEVIWEGPYSWPNFEELTNLPVVPKIHGVYLQTFSYQQGYLIYSAGITRRTILKRFQEHTKKYMNGDYNVLDIFQAQQGVRSEIWHGWGDARKRRSEFEVKRATILEAVAMQLAGFKIFVGHTTTEKRVMERIESAIMKHLYLQPPPICNIPDIGMMLAYRNKTETPLQIKNVTKYYLYGLPEYLEI